MVEKEQVVAKLLLNLSKSIIYSAVNTNTNHNNRTIVSKLKPILRKNSYGFVKTLILRMSLILQIGE